MMPLLLISLALWESIALSAGKPTVTDLSTRRDTGPLIWGIFVAFGIHLLEARRANQEVLRSRTVARW